MVLGAYFYNKEGGRLKKKIFIAFITLVTIIFGLLTALYIVGGKYCDELFHFDTKRNEDQYAIAVMYDSFDVGRYSVLKKEDVSIESRNRYKLYGTYIENNNKTQNTVIIVHGITGSRWEAMKYADVYLDIGYNVLVYDCRYHGKSGGDSVTYGFYEKNDLDDWVKFVKKKNPDGIIGVHGESLGAATALLHSAINEKLKTVSFYVSDCSYSDVKELLDIRLSEDYKIKSGERNIILDCAGILTMIKYGFSYDDVSPEKAEEKSTVPIMFIHGDDDEYIPCSMSKEMYDKKKGPKKLYIVEGAGHAQSVVRDKDEYEKQVISFLKENVLYVLQGN